eukprot:3088060-Pyramimonas_sp.AAC.1
MAAEGRQEVDARLLVVPPRVERAIAAGQGVLPGERVPGACEPRPQGGLEPLYRLARCLPGEAPLDVADL